MANMLDKIRSYVMGTDYEEDDDTYSEYEEDAEESIRDDREISARDSRNRDVMDITSLRQKRNMERGERTSIESRSGSGSKIVNFQQSSQMQVVIATPNIVSEAASICDAVRENKTVVVNLEGVERANAQRIADFLGGAAYSLQGDIQRISNEIFIIAPNSVQITGELKEELKSSGLILPWITSSFK